MAEFLIIRQFISQEQCKKMAERLDQFYSQGLSLAPDTQCTISPAFYGIFNDEALEFLPRIEQAINKKLYPTYTYSRIYKQSEILLPHKDRDECEISFTMHLQRNGDIWPMFLNVDNTTEIVMLDVGDILIYKGIEQLHWRNRLESNNYYQAFFHYVDQDGPYAQKRYDNKLNFLNTQQATDELIRKKHVLQ